MGLDVRLEVKDQKLGSVDYIPNILTIYKLVFITHWSEPLILTSWDIQVGNFAEGFDKKVYIDLESLKFKWFFTWDGCLVRNNQPTIFWCKDLVNIIQLKQALRKMDGEIGYQVVNSIRAPKMALLGCPWKLVCS